MRGPKPATSRKRQERSEGRQMRSLIRASLLVAVCGLPAPRRGGRSFRLPMALGTRAAALFNVLLIDDDEALLKAVGELVQERGYNASTAASGAEALSILRASDPRPDIIVSDIRMPGLDGFALLQQVRALPQYKDIPVVFLTAKALTRDRIQGYRAGVDAYLPKPFDPEELFSIMDNILVRRVDLAQEILGLRQDIRQLKDVMEQVLRQAPLPAVQYKKPPVYVTEREQVVLDMVALGYMNKEIAEDLGVTERTVEKRISSLLEKTNTVNRTELVRYALDFGLITPVPDDADTD